MPYHAAWLFLARIPVDVAPEPELQSNAPEHACLTGAVGLEPGSAVRHAFWVEDSALACAL